MGETGKGRMEPAKMTPAGRRGRAGEFLRKAGPERGRSAALGRVSRPDQGRAGKDGPLSFFGPAGIEKAAQNEPPRLSRRSGGGDLPPQTGRACGQVALRPALLRSFEKAEGRE